MEIINKSQWPDAFVSVVSRWLWKRLGRTDPHAAKYVFTFRAPSPERDVHGRAGRSKGFMRLGRRTKGAAKGLRKDWRFAWAPEYPINGMLEAFVFLLAHELRHGHPDNYALWSTGRRQGGEHDANHWAWEQVEVFREVWPLIRREILTARRLTRQRVREQKLREAEKRLAKNAPETKLARVLELRKQWERKCKLAQTKLKKLKRRESALRRFIDQRLAAKGNA